MHSTAASAFASAIRFDNRFVSELPGDPDASTERRQVLHACWSSVAPTPVEAPRTIAVSRDVAAMVVHWMSTGFVHGVMNTDNMSILGLTLDYGPCGWLDDYDPDWTPNTTDAGGRRYRYGQQPGVAQWNLVQLANATAPLFESSEPLQTGLWKTEAGSRPFSDSPLRMRDSDSGESGFQCVECLLFVLAHQRAANAKETTFLGRIGSRCRNCEQCVVERGRLSR